MGQLIFTLITFAGSNVSVLDFNRILNGSTGLIQVGLVSC